MHFSFFLRFLCLLIILGIPTSLSAREKEMPPPYAGVPDGWASFARGGVVYQPETDLDEGSSYSGARFTIQLGSGYSSGIHNSISFSVGYSLDGYDFSGDSGLGGSNPWEEIHTLSFSVPVRRKTGENWTTFIIPSIRSTGESGAGFDETLTGGVLGGVSYRVSDNLTIGPGIGIFSQLEDSATVIPILIIDWKLTERVTLSTGRGLGATMGPGLTLQYRPDDKWRFDLGGRYEKLRFRLDKDGTVESGIGEDSSFPVFLSSTYSFDRKTNLSLVGGVEFGGELRLEDKEGETIREESYDTGLFFGLTFNKRF
jgi:hypothetical protein